MASAQVTAPHEWLQIRQGHQGHHLDAGDLVCRHQQPVDDLWMVVDQLSRSLESGIESASESLMARNNCRYVKTSDCSAVVSDGKDYAFFLVA